MSIDRIVEVFRSFLRHHPTFNETEPEVLSWVADIARNRQLSGVETGRIVGSALEAAKSGSPSSAFRFATMIGFYTKHTGRPDEWDFVTNSAPIAQLYHGEHQNEEEALPLEVTEELTKTLGVASSIPDDGRLPLVFSKSLFPKIPLQAALGAIRALGELTEELKFGNVAVIDWGWPKSLWSAQRCCVYWLKRRERLSSRKTPQQEWQDHGYTFGLH